jgi:hypothetical protein
MQCRTSLVSLILKAAYFGRIPRGAAFFACKGTISGSLAYLDLMAEWCYKLRFKVWGYCLMPDHMHLIAAPKTADAWSDLSAKPISVTLFSESPA